MQASDPLVLPKADSRRSSGGPICAAPCRSAVALPVGATSGYCIAYLRTSSAANIGDDKDSGQRQQAAIETYAKRAGIDIIGSYYDEAVKGSDPIETRPGFAAMLEALEANSTKTIIVETANRFARDLMVQEVGFAMLKKWGVDLIADNAIEQHFAVEERQVGGVEPVRRSAIKCRSARRCRSGSDAVLGRLWPGHDGGYFTPAQVPPAPHPSKTA